MILKEYLKKPFDTPAVLKNKHKGGDILIIGTGTSTSKLLVVRDKIKNRFDAVIGLNYATNNFEDVIDYRLIVEKKADGFVEDLKNRKFRKDIVYIINWKSIEKYPKELYKIKTTRCNFGFLSEQSIIREYHYGEYEGLLIGPLDSKGLSAGTVSCQALHLACIMGAKNVYMIGADLMFKDGGDHYYGGNYYANSKTKIENRSPIININVGGKNVRTTEFFFKSAQFIDSVVVNFCNKSGIFVYDTSDGLVSSAIKIDLKDIFK